MKTNRFTRLQCVAMVVLCLSMAGMFIGWEETTTTVQQTSGYAAPPPPAAVTTTQTTYTETEHPGFVGGLFHVVGTLVGLPFQLVGDVLGATF